jgi:dihydroxyacetone kinase-like predicted kinase
VEIDGVKVKEGHIIALLNGKLVLSAKDLEKGCLGLLKKIDMDDYELITLFYGDTMGPEQVEEIASKISETYPDHEVEIQEGGQPHYQFIFAIE